MRKARHREIKWLTQGHLGCGDRSLTEIKAALLTHVAVAKDQVKGAGRPCFEIWKVLYKFEILLLL